MWGQEIQCTEEYTISEDHPHACGDKYCSREPLRRYNGSSPRVWGQVCYRTIRRHVSGIIPTRVGTRISIILLINILQDHPHACGDKCCCCISVFAHVGSSPRVWGQVSALFPAFWYLRIIPTRVGTSAILFCRCARS